MPNNSISDLILSIKNISLWWQLAFMEILQRYRRSILGPFWITISNAIFICALSIISHNLSKEELYQIITHISYGFITWIFISTTINESCDSLVRASGYIKNIIMPISSHIFVTLFKNIIIFFHNCIIIIIIFIFFGNINNNIIYFIPGFLILTIILFFIALAVSIVCARFRDLTPIIISINQILFFITPVWWSEKLLMDKELMLSNFNPFNHFISLVREPLLGNQINILTLIFIFLLLLVLIPFSLYIFSKTYKKIAFWI